MNETFAKLIAIVIVGSVAKSLFGRPIAVSEPLVEVVTNAAGKAARAASN